MVYQLETTRVQSPHNLRSGKKARQAYGGYRLPLANRAVIKRRIAAAQARYDQQAKKIDDFLDEVGPDLLLDRFVDHLSLGRLLEVLDFLLSRRDVDLVEAVINAAGSERALKVLDKLAAPQHVDIAS